jgi:hypothetical protein
MADLLERFSLKFEVRGLSECWPWIAYRNLDGYGMFALVPRRPDRAHRLMWQFENGAIPTGFCVLHTCDNPSCVNPNHLFIGTQKDNIADRDAKGRVACGQEHCRAKLTAAQVREIREAVGTHKEIGKRFSVGGKAVGDIKKGRTWRILHP